MIILQKFFNSLNTNNGKLDGFISASAEYIQKLLPQIQKLVLTVEQKDNRLFLDGDVNVSNYLIKILSKRALFFLIWFIIIYFIINKWKSFLRDMS